MDAKLRWNIFWNIPFPISYTSYCNDCLIKILQNNPWPLYKITRIEPVPDALKVVSCTHFFLKSKQP